MKKKVIKMSREKVLEQVRNCQKIFDDWYSESACYGYYDIEAYYCPNEKKLIFVTDAAHDIKLIIVYLE